MLPKQTNYTNLRQNLASILDEVIEDRGCVIVSRTGKEDVAILAASELSNMMETLHLLKSPANARKLFAAMERADQLEGVQVESQTLEELCEELAFDACAALLEEAPQGNADLARDRANREE